MHAFMSMRVSSRVLAISLLAGLAACAKAPSQINDLCAVFDQNDGWFNNWRSEARRAERKYGIPTPILMATVRKESGFKSNARPPRKKILGFIPGKRISSAYGYSQALDGTWAQYKRETGRLTARRNDFGDAVDFVGWYHSKTSRDLGVAPNDAYSLYLAYYSGWGGFKNGSWRGNSSLQRYAQETDAMARKYAAQMRDCD